MAEHALKEWAVTIEALRRGEQVVVLRKGGIGEKRFELPHGRFFLFPTYEHQRPELVRDEYHEEFEGPLMRREDPKLLPLGAYAELVGSHPIHDAAGLDALGPLHILAPHYAAERLRWRRKQPLWAVVLRVWRADPAPVLHVTEEHGGCVSWVELPDDIEVPSLTPALDDGRFRAAAEGVERALATAEVA